MRNVIAEYPRLRQIEVIHFGWISVWEKISKSGCSDGDLLDSYNGFCSRRILHAVLEANV
jgi:hypothetical protein